MRVTRDTLLKLARQTVQERMDADKGILAAYLTGSLLGEDPFLGGAADIDLVFVHRSAPPASREIVRLSNEISLDLLHRKKADYQPPRELRGRPRLGYEMYDPQLIQETGHFFEFTQASVRAGFDDPANLMQRAYAFLRPARERWMGLQSGGQDAKPSTLVDYLSAVEDAADVVAVLTGPPLTERRFLPTLRSRAAAIGRPGLSAGISGLVGGLDLDPALLREWLPAWEAAFTAAGQTHRYDPRLHAARLDYYRRGIESWLDGDTPLAALWPLLQTWTLSVHALPADSGHLQSWQSACASLGLGGEGFAERLEGLDRALDTLDEMLEGMTAQYGLEPM
ncbi:MAG: hypothetical protein AB1846_02450 [Chloroflexota bacterium]